MKDPNGELVIAIIYQNNLPFTVFSGSGDYCQCWDFDWCRSDGILAYEGTGSGGRPYIHPSHGRKDYEKIWVRPGIRIVAACGKERMRPKPYGKDGMYFRDYRDPKPYTLPAMARRLRHSGYIPMRSPVILAGGVLNPFEHPNAADGNAEWCGVCLEHRFEDWGGEFSCSHLHYCDGCGSLAGPGAIGSECKCVPNED